MFFFSSLLAARKKKLEEKGDRDARGLRYIIFGARASNGRYALLYGIFACADEKRERRVRQSVVSMEDVYRGKGLRDFSSSR